MNIPECLDRPIKVLSLEDSGLYQDILSSLIPKEYANITFCTSLKELSSLDPRSFDVILVDLTVEDSAGIKTFNEVEKYNVPCLVITSYSDPAYAYEALGKRAVDFIVKPVAKENLILKIVLAYLKGKNNQIPPNILEELKSYI